MNEERYEAFKNAFCELAMDFEYVFNSVNSIPCPKCPASDFCDSNDSIKTCFRAFVTWITEDER